MATTAWLGISLAIAASTFLNVGKGMQKWKVAVLANRRRVLSAEHRRNFAIWVAGVLLTMVATVLYSFALKFTDKPSTVSALNGVGLIGLVVFAWWVLKERVGSRELLGAVLVIAGTALMGAFDQPRPQEAGFSQAGFLAWCVGGVALYAPLALYSWRAKRWHGLVFGSMGGCMIGTSMVLGDMALADAGNDIFGQFGGPYVYLALIIGTGALGVTQLAFWRASAMVVVPTMNSFVICTPAGIQALTFGTILQPIQFVGLAVIVAGVVALTLGHKT
jgi:drug/metabolite transporter (DMT)-like permease